MQLLGHPVYTAVCYPLHLIDLLAKLYRKQLAKVKIAGTLSEWFHVKKGVRQGRVLSPYSFNILAEMVTRETLDGFQGGLQIGGRMITNLCYADDIILLATSETELQELVDRLDRVSHKCDLLISVDKTKVMVSDVIACRILIQNELLEQVDTFRYLRSLITEDGECTTEFRTRLNREQAIEASLQKIWRLSRSLHLAHAPPPACCASLRIVSVTDRRRGANCRHGIGESALRACGRLAD